MIKKIVIICSIIFVISIIGLFSSLVKSGDEGIFKIYNINEESSSALDDIDRISIDTTSADITFYLDNNQSDLFVKYHGYIKCLMCSEPNRLVINQKDNELNIKATQKITQIGIGMTEKLKLDIYLPISYDKIIDVHSVSGDIYLADTTLDELNISSMSGSIRLNNLTINKGKITITSGEVELDVFKVNDILTINITSGDVNIDRFIGNLEFKSLSGELEAQNFSGNFTGRSNSGDIELDVIGNEYNIDISVTSGDVDIYIKEKDFIFDIEVTSGNINIQFSYEVVNGNNTSRHKSGRVGNGQNIVKIKATSGEIELK